jgi:hypothetical protein
MSRKGVVACFSGLAFPFVTCPEEGGLASPADSFFTCPELGGDVVSRSFFLHLSKRRMDNLVQLLLSSLVQKKVGLASSPLSFFTCPEIGWRMVTPTPPFFTCPEEGGAS